MIVIYHYALTNSTFSCLHALTCSFLSTLADFVLHPETPTSIIPEDIIFPSLTPSLLLQTFLPIVAFPSYFETLFKFVFKLEQICRDFSLNFSCANLQRWVVQVLGYKSSSDPSNVAKVIDLVSQNLTSLLDIVNHEGFLLLLLHIYPFFQYPDTMFEAVYTFLDPLAQRMSRKNVERLFSCVLIQLFDSATEPHQRAQLLSRTTADLILKRFSLKILLERFLGFYIEAVIEPARTFAKISATKRQSSSAVLMKSQQSVLTLTDVLQSQVFEDMSRERGRTSDFTFSLALSEVTGHCDYDSDKDYSSDDSEEDEDYSVEMSLLVKTDVGHTPSAISSIVEVPEGGGGSTLSSLPLMPLMADHQEYLAAGSGDGVMAKTQTDTAEGGEGEEGVVGGGVSKHSWKPKESDSSLPASTSTTTCGAPLSQTHFTTTTTPDSPIRKGFSYSFSSVFSEDSTNLVANNDAQSTRESSVLASYTSTSTAIPASEEIATPALSVGKHVRSELQDPLSNEDEEDDDEENAETENTNLLDPQEMAVNAYLSEVAADCVTWLMRRLGPLLATQHIVKPLVDNLHCCFMGIVNFNGRERSAMKCLSSYAEYYGETVILRFYIPHAENLVSQFHAYLCMCM